MPLTIWRTGHAHVKMEWYLSGTLVPGEILCCDEMVRSSGAILNDAPCGLIDPDFIITGAGARLRHLPDHPRHLQLSIDDGDVVLDLLGFGVAHGAKLLHHNQGVAGLSASEGPRAILGKGLGSVVRVQPHEIDGWAGPVLGDVAIGPVVAASCGDENAVVRAKNLAHVLGAITPPVGYGRDVVVQVALTLVLYL